MVSEKEIATCFLPKLMSTIPEGSQGDRTSAYPRTGSAHVGQRLGVARNQAWGRQRLHPQQKRSFSGAADSGETRDGGIGQFLSRTHRHNEIRLGRWVVLTTTRGRPPGEAPFHQESSRTLRVFDETRLPSPSKRRMGNPRREARSCGVRK